MAPMEYLRKCRLERAASLLAEGSLNVSEVAAKVGMRDPLYFSRAFKARYGMAPTAYIKSHRHRRIFIRRKRRLYSMDFYS